MRHGKTVNHLGRKTAHRHAMLSNMASSLIVHKRISTTVAKAKALRKYVEPLITKSKEDTTHSRRTVFSYLQDKEAIKILFGDIAEKIAERNGGYTRIIKLGQRQGDNAVVAMIELVDFNDNLSTSAAEDTEAKSKRSRRGKSKKTETSETVAPIAEAAAAPIAEVEEEVTSAELVEEPAADVVETEIPTEESAPATDESSEEETK